MKLFHILTMYSLLSDKKKVGSLTGRLLDNRQCLFRFDIEGFLNKDFVLLVRLITCIPFFCIPFICVLIPLSSCA